MVQLTANEATCQGPATMEQGAWDMEHGYSWVRLAWAQCDVSWGKHRVPLNNVLQCQLNPSVEKGRRLNPVQLLYEN